MKHQLTFFSGITTPSGKSCLNICFIKKRRFCLSLMKADRFRAPVTDVSSQCLCLDEFSGQLTVRSQAAWEEWLAEDNDRFLHPLSKQATAPVYPAPLSLRSTCTSARVHEAWPEQGPEGMEEEHQDVQSVSGFAAACWMQKKKKVEQCVCILISLATVNTGCLLSMYWLFYWRHIERVYKGLMKAIMLAWCLSVWVSNNYLRKAALWTGNQ